MKIRFLILLLLFGIFSCDVSQETPYLEVTGETMGTYYKIIYSDSQGRNFKSEFDSLLVKINLDVSTYIPHSTISKFNLAKDTFPIELKIASSGNKANTHFYTNLLKSKEIYNQSNGSFDPTIMPLVNYWGFGYTAKKPITGIDSLKIDSLIQFVGLNKIDLVFEKDLKEKGKLIKAKEGVQLDFSALAKGYGVDAIGHLLDRKNIENYLVEIGGECLAKGKNIKGNWWSIGINTPKESAAQTDFSEIIQLQNQAIATSGNYRNYYEVKGEKYAHIILPTTGFPEKSDLLSASVIAKDCMTADAYATTFMVMGKDKALTLANQLEGIETILIYGKPDGTMGTAKTNGLKNDKPK